MPDRQKPFPLMGLDRVGVVKDLAPDQIRTGGWQSAENIRFRNGKVLALPGFAPFIPTAVEVAGRIMHGDQFLETSGTFTLVVLTKLKAYKFNTVTELFDNIQGAEPDFTNGDGNLFDTDTAFNLFLITNFLTTIKKWTGSGAIADLGGLTDAFPGAIVVGGARIIRAFNDFVVLYHTKEDGNTIPTRIRWSRKGQAEVWKNDVFGSGQAGFTDLKDTPDFIINAHQINNYMAIYKEDSIWLQSYVGLPVVFAFRKIIADQGLYAQRAVANLGNQHLFLSDDNFYSFNGSSVTPIGDAIRDFFFADLSPGFRNRVQAYRHPEFSEVWWAYPSTNSTGDLDKIAIFNYKVGTWSFAKFTITSIFEHLNTKDFTWITIPDTTWDSAQGTWDERSSLALSPKTLLGRNDGKVMQFGDVFSHDGADYTKQIISKHYDFGLPGVTKRLLRLRFNVAKGFSKPLKVFIGHVKDIGDTIQFEGPFDLTMVSSTLAKLDVDITDVYFIFRFETTENNDPWELSGFVPWFIQRNFQ